MTYQVQVATDAGFVTIVDSPTMVRSGDIQTSVASQLDLAEDTVHYWRVRATNGTVTTSWSSSAVFRTPAAAPPPPPPPSPSPQPSPDDELDPNQVTWLHANMSNWTISSTVTGVTFSHDNICVRHTKAGQWPPVGGPGTDIGGKPGEGSPWVFAKINGQWYGGTYEFSGRGPRVQGDPS